MYDLAKEGMPITLAVSLHAPNDALRRRIMPIAEKYPLDEVLKAARHYFDVTGRKVTFEYILIKGLTCTNACAKDWPVSWAVRTSWSMPFPSTTTTTSASTGPMKRR